jgi:cytochrome c biogenesis protein CcmG, thiol:disulfide interchange protein DsbE
MSRRRMIGLGLVLLAVGGVIAAEVATTGGGRATRPAPALPNEVLSGHRVGLASLRGKPALVNFWASWCGPCKQEAPELRRFARVMGHRASLVGVDWNDRPDNARAFIAQSDWTYPVLRDSSGDVGTAYGLNGLPTTFVLDASGKIVQMLQGPQTAASLEQAVAAAG